MDWPAGSFEAALAGALRRRLGRELAAATRLSGGASQETWAVDAAAGNAREPLILRRRPGGASETTGSGIALETEARLLELAARAGVPVPAVRRAVAPAEGLGSG